MKMEIIKEIVKMIIMKTQIMKMKIMKMKKNINHKMTIDILYM